MTSNVFRAKVVKILKHNLGLTSVLDNYRHFMSVSVYLLTSRNTLCFQRNGHYILGAFTELREATITLRHVCPSVRWFVWNNSAPTERIFMKLSVFRKSVQKIQVSLKSYKNNGYFTLRPTHIFYNISLSSSYNAKCFSHSCREYQNTFYVQ